MKIKAGQVLQRPLPQRRMPSVSTSTRTWSSRGSLGVRDHVEPTGERGRPTPLKLMVDAEVAQNHRNLEVEEDKGPDVRQGLASV
jgi:hypothetical protein